MTARSRRWTGDQIADQTGRVAVVTGANSGVGYETAKALAARGAAVVVASRSERRGTLAVGELRRSLPGVKIELMRLDLASLDSVRAFADRFTARYDRLDILINNAGIMNPPTRQETDDGFELQFGTNHLGHFALTLLLLRRLTDTDRSRIVNVASYVQNYGTLDLDDPQWTARHYRGMGAYAASKIANMLFTLELQRRLEASAVTTAAVAAHPGWTGTNLQRTSRFIMMVNPLFAMKPWQGALPILYAAVSGDVEPGGYYGPDGLATLWGYPVPNGPAKASRDAGAARRLWDLSEHLTDVRWSLREAGEGTERPGA